MKKSMKITMAIALTLVTFGASAQFGVKFGYSNLSQKIERAKTSTNPKASINPGNLSGFTTGVFYDIRLPVKGLSIRPGINYTFGTGKIRNDAIGVDDVVPVGVVATVKQIEHALNTPIDIKYAYGFTDDFKVYAFAGPKFAIGLLSTFKISANGKTVEQDNFNGSATYEGVTVGSEDGGIFSRYDVRFGIGTGVQFKSFLFEVGYDWGLLNRLIATENNEGFTWETGQLFAGVGFMF